jgi:hypothetical protein
MTKKIPFNKDTPEVELVRTIIFFDFRQLKPPIPLRHLYSLILSILLFCQLNAQKNYKQGLVVLSNGDTLHGWIDYRNWKVNPKAITFKKDSLSEDFQKFTTNDITLFKVTGFDIYIKAIVKKDMLPVELSALTMLPHDTTITDTVFLRTVVTGKVLNLYELVDFKPRYYIQDDSKEYVELIYKRYLDETNISLITQNIYRNQLNKYAADQKADEKLIRKIVRIGYKEQDIAPVVIALNKISGGVAYTSDYNKKSYISLFAGAGSMYTKLKFSGDNNGLSGMDFKSKVVPVITAGLDIFALRNLRDLALRLQVSYNSTEYKASKVTTSAFPTIPGDTLEYDIKQNNFTPSIGLIYNFIRKESFRYYLGAQLGLTLSSYPTNRLTKFSYTGKSATDNYLDYEKHWVTVNIQTGAVINNKLEVGLTGNIAGSFVNYSYFSGRPSMYSLWVGYHFK